MVSIFIALCGSFAYFVYTRSLIVIGGTPTSVSLIQEWVELTGLQQLVGFIVSFILLVLMKKPIWHSDQKLVLIALTVFCNVMGNLATNAVHTTLGSSTARIVETTQPLITFVLARVSLKSSESLTVSNFLSVSTIVLGVCGFVSRDMSYNNWSFLLAVVLTVAFTVRNIMLKKMSSEWDSSLQKFMIVSLLSVVLVFPLWLVTLAYSKTLSTELNALHTLSLSAVSHSVYNLASFNVLESVALVSHAIYTIFIKASSFLVTNILVYQMSDSWNLIFSVCVVLVGTYLYWLQSNSSTKPWQNILKFLFGMFIIAYLFAPTTRRMIHMDVQHSVNPNPINGVSANCERISTAWMYEKAIPDGVLSNIVALADQNPSIPVHIYCGSTQCLEAMETRNRTNMDVKFAVVSDIVKGLTVLEDWLARHPVNKVLAGREFETHIQEVTTIGILWQHGGIYVSPVLKLARDFGDVCQNTTSWVAKNETQHLESVLDLSFFVKNHPFIYKVAHLYAKKYPTTRSNSGVLRQGFLNTILKQNPCTAHCPKVLRGIPEILKSDYSQIDQSQIRHFGLSSRQQSAAVANLDSRMQEFAMAHFFPFIDTFMDLDDPIASKSAGNGDILVFLSGLGQTEKWQLLSNVKPIMLSLHLQEVTDGLAAKMKYLKKNEPIGCADSTTLDFLNNRNVSSFLSGSLMLQLSNPPMPKHNGIVLSNLDDEVVKLLPTEIKNGALHLEQSVRDGLFSNDIITRFEATHQLLEKYKTAGLVITQSFHCASACAASATPVIFVNTASSLASGMTSLFHTLDWHNMTKDQVKQWFTNFSWKDVPPNPGVDLLMQLRATAWNVIRQNQALFDTAKKLGVIPMSPPRILPKDQKILFHMIHTSGAFNWRHWRSVESVFRHHPTSKLIFHSNTLTQRTFDVLTEVGYSIVVSPYDMEELLRGSPADAFIPKLESARKTRYWVYTESDLIRLLSIYKWGGVYLDTDIYLVRPLYTLRENGACYENKIYVNNAFLYFEKGHPFIREVLETFALKFDFGDGWGKNGPKLFTNVWDKWKQHHNHTSTDEHAMQPYSTNYFYMINWSTVKKDCFETVGGERFDKYMNLLHTQAYGLHINAKITGDVGTTGEEMKKGTLCSYLLNEFCVLCNTVY